MSRLTVIACALIVCGCHESLGLVGDARMDPSVDAPVDAVIDSGHDVVVDPTVDPSVDPTPELPCPPRSEDGSYIDFYLDGEGFLRYDLELICTLEEFEEDPAAGTFEFMLACRSDEGLIEERRLFFQTHPIIPINPDLFAGEDLIVRYVADPIFWVNRWVTIHSYTHGLLLAAMDAEYVLPGDREHWYDPLEVWTVGGRCPTEDDYCGTLEREGIEVSFWDRHASVIVFDGNMKPLEDPDNMYNVLVSKAHRYHFVTCEDVPLTWVQALISRLP